MPQPALIEIAAPRFEIWGPILIAGLQDRFKPETSMGIPALWERFGTYNGRISNAVDGPAYGVSHNFGEGCSFDYLAGVEVSNDRDRPPECSSIRIEHQRYAVFAHADHISTIQNVCHTIFNQWLPESRQTSTGGPVVERYGEEFDPRSGAGGFEIWVPIAG